MTSGLFIQKKRVVHTNRNNFKFYLKINIKWWVRGFGTGWFSNTWYKIICMFLTSSRTYRLFDRRRWENVSRKLCGVFKCRCGERHLVFSHLDVAMFSVCLAVYRLRAPQCRVLFDIHYSVLCNNVVFFIIHMFNSMKRYWKQHC